MVGVIPRVRRCGRDAGLRFHTPPDHPHLTAHKDRLAIDGAAPHGLSGARGLRAHLTEDCQAAARSSRATRPSTLARSFHRPARRLLADETARSAGQDFVDTPMHAARAPLKAAAGPGERERSAAIGT